MKRVLEWAGAFFAGMVIASILMSTVVYQMQKRMDTIRSSQLYNSARTSMQFNKINSKIDSLQVNLKKYESSIKLSNGNIHPTKSQVP